ncbi:helix-turn-helix domain-containing protein [Streptomyces kronopolitis]|uniref:MmyB family transcriptional regulator n=1 Tax=Streptomyces kronopolitis TaxID=1612435 RepID=UPI003D99C78E
MMADNIIFPARRHVILGIFLDAAALQKLLRTHRSLIAPEVHGLQRPQRQGRRAAGLTQQQMDELLNRSAGTYGRLETGRYKNPSIDLLRDVALTLALNEQEWTALCRYARGEDPPSTLRPRSGQVVPGWFDVIHGISHMAYITDPSYDLVCHNETFAGLFPDTGPPANMLRWMLLDDKARGTLPNPDIPGDHGIPGALTGWRDIWAPYLLPQLSAARALMPDDPVLAAIEHDVRADPRTGPLYATGCATQVHPDGHVRPLLHPTLGPGWVAICAAEPLSSPNFRVMIVPFYPGQTRGRHLASTALTLTT